MRFQAAAFLLLILTWGVAAPAQKKQSSSRPNVLIILADDMGFSDTGCFGGEIDTPNIDSLAENGLKFSQFYNNARCCPSRASLLTGLYPHETGMGHMMFERNLAGYRGDLNRQCVTIAEVLGDAGYNTYAIGKWHLTRHDHPDSPSHNWPLQRGFQKYYGMIWGYSSFYDPAIVRGNYWYSRESDPEYESNDFYFTNALSDNAVDFLREHDKESPDKPFFMYTAYTAAHWPMHALEKDIAKYKGRFDEGYDKLRTHRAARLRKMGLIDPEWELTPTAEKWEDVQNREWELRCMEVYAAMIDCMDRGIGQIISELKRQNRFENTLILFMQDNGGCAEDRGRLAPKEQPPKSYPPLKWNDLPGGTIPKQTRDGKPVRTGPQTMPGGPDTYISYGPGWANVSNTPFREYKHWVHEGGIATPLIAHWPQGIKSSLRNRIVKDPAHLIDIMATCVDVAKAKYPVERGGETIRPSQGVSLKPLFEGNPIKRSQPLFWEHEGNRAVRDGKWKLVAKENEPWELYDMEEDRTELHNLAAKFPDRVKELASKWDEWAAKSNVLPLGGWRAPEREKLKPANAESSARSKPGEIARVELKANTVVPANESPIVHDRALTITVELIEPKGDGVLVSQGGKLHGYSFYIKYNRLAFDVRRKGPLKTVLAGEILKPGVKELTAVLEESGSVKLLMDNRVVAEEKGVGLLLKTPAQRLSTSSDADDPVGKYAEPFKYEGKLGRIALETMTVK